MLTSEEVTELIDLLAETSSDPYKFVLAFFAWGEGELAKHDGPDEWQTEVLCYVRDRLQAGDMTVGEAVSYVIRIAIASGHGIGKSALVAWIILWGISTFEDTKGIVTANTEKQLRTKTWAELAKWHRLFLAKELFICDATAIYSSDPEHKLTWRIDMIPWSEKNPEAFAGLHNQGKRIIIIFDEASAIADAIWEVTEGALTDADTQILWFAFGNPTRNSGRFRECFRKFLRLWFTKQIDARKVKMSNKALLKEWVDTYGENSDFVKMRVKGIFPSASARQFISIANVDNAYGRNLRKEQYSFAPVILTCDPAAEGDDMLEIGMRQGLAFFLLRTIPKNDNDIHIANILANMENEYLADAVFIDGGFGTGIVSAGKTMGRNWTIVWFASESADPGCLNKRAEIYNLTNNWLKEGGAIPENLELYEELTTIETVPRLDGKIQLESKKEYKKRIGRSPGKADVLALSFAYPVQKKSTARAHADKNGQYFANSGQRYNPLERR